MRLLPTPRRLPASLAFALFVFAITALAQSPQVIRIGIANAPSGNPRRLSSGSAMAIANVRGLIEEEFRADGIKIEWYFFKGTGPAVNEALTNHQLDFALQGDLPSIIGRANGLKTRVLLILGSRTNAYLLVPPQSTVRAVADIRGKRIAFSKGTMTQLPVNRILEANGMSERDIRAVNLDTGSAQAALVNQDIDGLFGGAALLKLRDQGVARVVYSTKSAPTFTGQTVMLVTETFADKHPRLTQRTVKALARAAHWSSDDANREEVFRIWALGGTPASVWREEFEGTPLAVRLSPRFDPFVVARLKDAVADAYRFRLIRKNFEVTQWIAPAYLDTALKELKLEKAWPQFDANGNPLAP